MSDEGQKKRDWLALLGVPLALLFINWTNARGVEARAAQREVTKMQSDLITQLIRDVWVDGTNTEVIGSIPSSRHRLADPDFVKAKQSFNENKSKLYADMLKVQILFDSENGKKLATELRKLIALGAKEGSATEYALDASKGDVREEMEKVEQLCLDVLRETIGEDRIRSSW